MDIADRIKEERVKRGLTQEQMGELVGLSKSAISNYERRDRVISPEVIIRYMKALSLDANHFFIDSIDRVRYVRTREENRFLEEYRRLDAQGQKVVRNAMHSEMERVRDSDFLHMVPSYVKVFLYTDIDAIQNENGSLKVEIPIPDTPLNRLATKVLLMPDDSMEPVFHKGDKLLVREATNANVNEIGVFVAEGKIVIRKMKMEELVSENPSYGSIKLDGSIFCLARVIDKLVL